MMNTNWSLFKSWMTLLKTIERKISLRTSKVYPIERIISALTYLSAGFIGAIWLSIAAIMGKNVTLFLRYHIFQSIFLSLAYFVITTLLGYLYVIIVHIPLVNLIPLYLNTPISMFMGYSVLQVFTTGVILYLAITSFMGMFSYFPWVSDIINQNLGRK